MVKRSGSFPMRGGVDEETPPLSIPPGSLIGCLNYESAPSGYRRIDGYERFDGRPAPSDATLGYDPATQADLTSLDALATTRRNAITVVPGSGAVRGVLWFEGKLHAWRDSGGGTQGIAYYSSSAGWTAHALGKQLPFTSGGTYEIVAGNTITGATSGATGLVRSVYLYPETAWANGNAAGIIVLTSTTGTFVAENLNVGANLNVATIAAAPTTSQFPPGGRYDFTIHNFYASTGTEAVYGANGVGQAFQFDGDSIISISTGMPVDAPFLVEEHKSHLFLAFPGGSLQHSALGEPISFSAILGAAELGLGHEITNLIPNAQSTLIITTDEKVNVLTGNDSSDWLLEGIGDEDVGAKAGTAQRVGPIIYLDNRGIRSASSTDTYGNFRLGTLTTPISKTLKAKQVAGIQPVASVVVKSKDQYLLFFEDGSGFSLFFGTKRPEACFFQYPFVVSCIHRAEVDGRERVWVGATNGFVYELNVGRSFDGDFIGAYAEFPYAHQGGPRSFKRYHSLELGIDSPFGVGLGILAQFDFAKGSQPRTESLLHSLDPGGAAISAPDWPTFTFYAPEEGWVNAFIDGSGFNIGLIIVSRSKLVESHTLETAIITFSPRGAKR